MPATTTKYALPYPLGSEPVSGGDDALRKLAQSGENMVQVGTVTITNTVVGTATDNPVVFPVPFAAPPVVVLVPLSTAPQAVAVTVSSTAGTLTANGFTARGNRVSGGTAGDFTAMWLAVGKVNAVA